MQNYVYLKFPLQTLKRLVVFACGEDTLGKYVDTKL